MKKITFLVLTFFLCTSFKVGPKNYRTVSPGDVIDVYISEDGPENFDELKNKRLGPSIYVLDTDNDNRLVKAIISKPVDEKKIDYKVEYINLNIQQSQEMTVPSYFTLDSKSIFEIKRYSKYFIIVLVLLFFLALVAYVYKKITESRKRKTVKNEMRNSILKARERKDFEQIYRIRKELKVIFCLSHKEMKDFETTMNRFQYQKTWTDEDFNVVKKQVEKIKNSIGI